MTALITAEYKGAPYSFQGDGWFNATVAAKRHGKLPKDWLKLDETRDYISALNEVSNGSQNPIWHTTKRGNNGGTWMHPKLAVRFAQWLDVRFAVWCDMQIDAILRGEAKIPRRKRGQRLKSLNTRQERHALRHYAVEMELSCHLSPPKALQLLGCFAGVKRLNLIAPDSIPEVEGFAARAIEHQTSDEDWKRVEYGRQLLAEDSPQLELT